MANDKIKKGIKTVDPIYNLVGVVTAKRKFTTLRHIFPKH